MNAYDEDIDPLIPQFPFSSHRLSLPRQRPTVWPIHDLILNELLLWILPTHRRTLMIKFCTVVGMVIYVAWKWMSVSVVSIAGSPWWQASVFASAAMFLLYWCYYYRRVLIELAWTSNTWWMDPGITHQLRLPMHVPMRHYATEEQARRGACCILATDDSRGPNVWCLDAMPWKFSLQDTVQKGLAVVSQDSTVVWQDMKVPSNWTMVDTVPDNPIYTNQKYPFPCQPPLVPYQNPTGIYRLAEFDLPEHWQSDALSSSFTILLHGIESAAYVYCNGALVGFTKDSRLPAEFDITQHLRTDNNNIHIVVIRWSDGSYVEDQDHWWMAGIHRSVELVRRRPGASLVDFQVQADANGSIAVQTWTKAKCTIVARLYDDEQLTADGDRWRRGDCVWEASRTTAVAQGSKSKFGAVLSGTVENPKLWNAEEPKLYTLTVTVLPDDGGVAQVESCRVGFRTVDILDGMVHVNGVPITVCGINRHEHDPDHGKVVSLELMKKDICTMKQNNFNLVRTSHYPTHSAFYRLCDYYGLYVWDEANIETHGMKPMGRLAQDWGWEATFVSRIVRTVQRDRNHASIIFWSMGNEAGRGRNLWKARKLVKSLDLSRPVVYEGGGSLPDGTGWTELTDVICSMYPDVDRTKRLASRAKDDRPVILCEYSHAMGNSNGNLHLYWDAIWDKNFPKLQGGAIWDFVDQGLRLPDPNHKSRCYFGYGGDFGDKINDAQFCINGMWTPDRCPHPAVHEIKFLQQPVSIMPEHCNEYGEILLDVSSDRSASLTLKVENRYGFRKLDHIEWIWTVTMNRSPNKVRSEKFCIEANKREELVYLQLDSGTISRMQSIARTSSHTKFWITLSGSLKKECEWAPKGHQLVSAQYTVKLPLSIQENSGPRMSMQSSSLTYENTGNTILVYNESQPGKREVLACLNKTSGGLMSYSPLGRNLLEDEMIPSFCRAFTDNDRGGMELTLDMMFPDWCYHIYWMVRGTADFSYASHWKLHGLDPHCPPTITCVRINPIEDSGSDRISIELICDVTSNKNKSRLFKVKLRYDFYCDGRVQVAQNIKPCRTLQDVPSLARLGMRLVLKETLYHIQYEGRGPSENYPDRKTGSHFGLYSSTPADMAYLQYIVPSENGNRSDCSFVSFRETNGAGFCLVNSDREGGQGTFSYSAQLHSMDELHLAKHTSDLQEREDGKHPIHVNIDGILMGIGGDNSWFPVVYPQYLVSAKKEYTFFTSLLPLRVGEEAIDVVATNWADGQGGGRAM